MKTLILMVLAWVAVGIGGYYLALKPAKARCQWCYQGPCFNHSICGQNCVCMKTQGRMEGSCASFN